MIEMNKKDSIKLATIKIKQLKEKLNKKGA